MLKRRSPGRRILTTESLIMICRKALPNSVRLWKGKWALLNDPAVKEAIQNLEVKLLEYYPDVDMGVVRKAVEFSVTKHGDQRRSSGEPYIVHPIGVSAILAELHLDLDSILTGILH